MHVFGGSIMRRYQAFIAGLLLQVAAIRPSEATRVLSTLAMQGNHLFFLHMYFNTGSAATYM